LARTILGTKPTDIDGTSSLPAYEVAQQAVETFFNTYSLVYPFLDKHELVKDMELAYVRLTDTNYAANTDESQAKELMLYMVFALGTLNREINGEVEKGTVAAFKTKAMSHLSSVVSSESLVSGVPLPNDGCSGLRV
jgi:hypothetical protein